MNDSQRDAPERDAWLRAALAHAPDAGIGAPPALSAAILRAAAWPRPAAPPRPWQGLMVAWAWLGRPPVAAGFASVMVAGVVGLMWWERPMDEVMPRSPVPPGVAATPVAVAPAETRSSAIVATRRAPPPAAAEEPLARTIATAPTAAKPDAKPDAKPAAREATKEITKAPAETAVNRDSAPQTAPKATPATPPAPAAPSPAAPPPARAVAEHDLRLRRDESVQADAAQVIAPGAATAMARSAAPSPARAPATATATANPPAAAEARSAEGPSGQALMEAPSPLALLLSRWPAVAEAWRWQPLDASAPQPADAAAKAWLQRVERATRGRWSARAEGAAEPGASGPTVMWWQGDALLGTLQFQPEGLGWQGADGRRVFAPLDADTRAALRRP